MCVVCIRKSCLKQFDYLQVYAASRFRWFLVTSPYIIPTEITGKSMLHAIISSLRCAN